MSQSYERPWTKMASMEELQGKNPAGKKKKKEKKLKMLILRWLRNILMISMTSEEILRWLARQTFKFINIWCENEVFGTKENMPIVKHSIGKVMVWACFAISGPGWLAVIKRIMKSTVSRKSCRWDIILFIFLYLNVFHDVKHFNFPQMCGRLPFLTVTKLFQLFQLL